MSVHAQFKSENLRCDVYSPNSLQRSLSIENIERLWLDALSDRLQKLSENTTSRVSCVLPTEGMFHRELA
jgi:hypothetical protein